MLGEPGSRRRAAAAAAGIDCARPCQEGFRLERRAAEIAAAAELDGVAVEQDAMAARGSARRSGTRAAVRASGSGRRSECGVAVATLIAHDRGIAIGAVDPGERRVVGIGSPETRWMR